MKILSTAEVAEKLNITVDRVHALIRKGRISATKVSGVYIILEEDLKKVSIRGTSKPGKDVTHNAIQRYWDTNLRGLLALDYKAVERDWARTRGQQFFGGLVIESRENRLIKKGEPVSINGKKVKAIEATPYRLGTGFAGRLILAQLLLTGLEPKAVDVIGLVAEADQGLVDALMGFLPRDIIKRVKFEVRGESYGSPYSKLNKFERERIEVYSDKLKRVMSKQHGKSKSLLLLNHVVFTDSASKGHPIQGILLPESNFTNVEELNSLKGYPGKVILLHAIPKRLNLSSAGRALASGLLIRSCYELEEDQVESVILCTSGDTLIEPILEKHFPFVKVNTSD
jgi:excisionase family DNA binding protein